MKKSYILIPAALCAIAASALFYWSFTEWIPVIYGVSAVLYAASAAFIAAGYAEKRRVLKGIIAGAVFIAFFFGMTFLINNIIFGAVQARLAASVVCGILLVFFVCFYLICSRGKSGGKLLPALTFIICIIITGAEIAHLYLMPMYYEKVWKDMPAPSAGVSVEKTARGTADDADYYVSPSGNDSGTGTKDDPFLTIERAKEAVRNTDRSGRDGITVAVFAGEYKIDSLEFTSEDGGTEKCPVTYTAYGDGEVILNGGVTIPRGSFSEITDSEVSGRLPADAAGKVLQISLDSLGITAEQAGKIYAIGNYNTAYKYDGDWTGDIYCELFVDDERMTVARYPDKGEYLYTGKVISEGRGGESSNASIKVDFEDLRNPEPDVYEMDSSLSERIKGWKSLADVWMFGYWRYDWADASTPVGNVDHNKGTISPMFVSRFGAKKDAPYYFFNVFEEMDSPGEWYLDRENNILYLYPPEGCTEDSNICLSISTGNIIKGENADYLTFDGFTVKGTRGDAVSLSGNHITVRNCLIKNVSGNALILNGYENTARDNEITHTGKGGIIIGGGDRETLKPGSSRADNNLIHDWSEIYETYEPAVTLNDVGNICSHNEIYNSPHEAITYSGNNHIIEYNLIHDVNLKTDDGGAIYSGRRWDWYGIVIRYNCIYNLGADGFEPVGIYLDDALSGQSVYGNLIINAPRFGIQLGGGRDLDVHDNIVVNSRTPLSYDARALSGLPGNEGSNFYPHYKEGGDCWKLLDESPWQSEAWQTAFPQMTRFSDDFSDTDNPDFVLNPSYSNVTHNIFISSKGDIGDVSSEAEKYSTIEDNACFRLSETEKIFVDPEGGDYTLRDNAPVDFEIDVPEMSEFGRQPAD